MPKNSSQTVLVIPAYNEEKNLPILLDSLCRYRDNTIVVDDNSEDGTSEVIKRHGFCYVTNTENKGTSGSIVAGLHFALSKGYKYAITLDADGQHDPAYIESFAKEVEKGYYVCGNRFNRLDFIPSNKLTSNCFASKMVKKYFHAKIPDVACGYRAFNIKKYLELSSLYAYRDFELIYISILHAITSKAKIRFVSVPAIYCPKKLWDTPRKEILSLIMSIGKYKKDDGLMLILNSLKKRCTFECVVDNTMFYFHYLSSTDSYFIETDLKEIFSYYGKG